MNFNHLFGILFLHLIVMLMIQKCKIIKLLGKLQSYVFSHIFICSDREVVLIKYHIYYNEKFFEPYIN